MGAVLINLSAANDTVWRDRLMYKLAEIIHNKRMLHTLSLMTGERCYQVSLDRVISKNMKQNISVPLGSDISPFLFNVYMRDMPSSTFIRNT